VRKGEGVNSVKKEGVEYYGVKNSVGGYRVFVIWVIAGGVFFVNVEPFYGVKVWAFLVEL